MRAFEGIRKLGTWLFDFLAITVLLTLSLVLIFPFPFILTGVHNYLLYKFEDRRLANIFNILKPNWRILLKFSVFWGLMVGLSTFEIVFFNIRGQSHPVLTFICYVILILSIILITDAPIIVLRMNVTLKQLLFNCITLIYGCWWFLTIAFLLTIGYVVAFAYFPYIGGAGLYFLVLVDNLASRKAIRNLMAKARKVKPEEILEPENMDVPDESFDPTNTPTNKGGNQ